MKPFIFRDRIDSPCPIAGRGTLGISEHDDIAQYIGSVIPFAITSTFSDFPLHIKSQAVLLAEGDSAFFDFEVVQMEVEQRNSPPVGRLLVLSKVAK